MTPPKWLKIAVPMQTWLKTQGKAVEADFRRMRRYAVQGRIVAPDRSNGAWQAFEGVPWVVHPGATVKVPKKGNPNWVVKSKTIRK